MATPSMERSIFPADVETRLKEEFFHGARDGFFVDVGANEPTDGSQTWHLEKLGWRGVVIEPQPRLAQKLKEQRRAAVFACACSSPQNAGKMLPFQTAGISFVAQSRIFCRRHAQGRNYRSAGAHARRHSCRGRLRRVPIDLLVDRCRKPRNRCPERANADAMAAAIDIDRRHRSESAAAPAVERRAVTNGCAERESMRGTCRPTSPALSRSVGTLAVLAKVLSRHAVPQFARI